MYGGKQGLKKRLKTTVRSLSWSSFIAAIKRKFYPLAYMQNAIMDWKNFRKLKGKSVQDYTHEFRRRALILDINLYSQETLLKYVGGLHSYLRNTILMFNPTNIYEVCVQATHLEARGKQNIDEKIESEGKGKGKFYGRGKRYTSFKTKKEKLACKNFSRTGHDEDHYWKLLP